MFRDSNSTWILLRQGLTSRNWTHPKLSEQVTCWSNAEAIRFLLLGPALDTSNTFQHQPHGRPWVHGDSWAATCYDHDATPVPSPEPSWWMIYIHLQRPLWMLWAVGWTIQSFPVCTDPGTNLKSWSRSSQTLHIVDRWTSVASLSQGLKHDFMRTAPMLSGVQLESMMSQYWLFTGVCWKVYARSHFPIWHLIISYNNII